MLLENQTCNPLRVEVITFKETFKATLKPGEKYDFSNYGKRTVNEAVKINSPEGNAIIHFLEDEIYWENSDKDFLSDTLLCNYGSLKFEEDTAGMAPSLSRRRNGICITITGK